jgi:phosphatidylserine decarboxylase
MSSIKNLLLELFKNVGIALISFVKNTHKEGHIFIGIAVASTMFFFFFWNFLGCVSLILTVWCIYFFRDPERVTPHCEGLVVAPADGVVTFVGVSKVPSELGMGEVEMQKISIFLSVFNVHVNRMPVAGVVKKLFYVPGAFVSATLDKSSTENERNIILLENEKSHKFIVVQIAGLIARRIVSYAKEGDSFKSGDRYGIIRFGSRVDVYIPNEYKIYAMQGQSMVGGETVIAQLIQNG